jgi:hypothetical protein
VTLPNSSIQLVGSFELAALRLRFPPASFVSFFGASRFLGTRLVRDPVAAPVLLNLSLFDELSSEHIERIGGRTDLLRELGNCDSRLLSHGVDELLATLTWAGSFPAPFSRTRDWRCGRLLVGRDFKALKRAMDILSLLGQILEALFDLGSGLSYDIYCHIDSLGRLAGGAHDIARRLFRRRLKSPQVLAVAGPLASELCTR